jgi:hypothetical protein
MYKERIDETGRNVLKNYNNRNHQNEKDPKNLNRYGSQPQSPSQYSSSSRKWRHEGQTTDQRKITNLYKSNLNNPAQRPVGYDNLPNRKNGGHWKKNRKNQSPRKSPTNRPSNFDRGSQPVREPWTGYDCRYSDDSETQESENIRPRWENTDHSYYHKYSDDSEPQESENIRPHQCENTDHSYYHKYSDDSETQESENIRPRWENTDHSYYHKYSDDSETQESENTYEWENPDYSPTQRYRYTHNQESENIGSDQRTHSSNYAGSPESEDLLYQCELNISTPDKQYNLEDKFILSNPDITRRLRDQLTLTLQSWIKKNISILGPFSWKCYEPLSKKSFITRLNTETEFDNCEASTDFNALLHYVRTIRPDIPHSVFKRLSLNRNNMCHGAHINTTDGRTKDNVADLFKDVNYLLNSLEIQDPNIEALEKSFKELRQIRQKAKRIKQNPLTEDQMIAILNYIAINQDNPSVKELISYVIAPRIINLEAVIYN